VRQLRMLRIVSEPARALKRLGACATVVILAAPTATATPRDLPSRASSAASAGVVYGGVTAQRNPIVLEFNKRRGRLVRAVAALDFSCAAGGGYTYVDSLVGVRVSKKGKFATSFTQTVRNDDRTTTDFAISLSGALNEARTKVSGKWAEKITEFDTAGATTDTCDAGTVNWTARQ
jgi:hypothetical protein